ncbi:NAD(P)-dependent oxidoreductase [Oricola nitratireducens]|uniref:NAD(P)-dependent oxidoreductase n=1 Tax=Oricola nitratireducens TaxID=2775868 RepID=UPI0031BA28BE
MMDSNKKITIGFIGLGVMGGPMCRNLVRKMPDARIVVFDKSVEAIQSVADRGAEVACSAEDAARQSDVVLLSLPNGDAVRQVVDAIIGSIRADALVIDTSTSPVDVTKEMAQRIKAAGGEYLDAPIARTRAAAENGTLSIMVGGGTSAFQRVFPILQCMGSEISHCGPVGSGQIVKILNNMVLFQTVHALSEALAIGTLAGVDGKTLFDVFSKGSADSFALRNHGCKALLADDFPPRAFSTDYARKDNAYAIALAESVGVTPKGARLLDEVFDLAQQQTLGEFYFPVFHKLHSTD